MQRKLSHSMPEYVQAARHMLYLVKAVHLTNESLYEGAALQRALWRYESLWLPLLIALTVELSSVMHVPAGRAPQAAVDRELLQRAATRWSPHRAHI